MQEAADTIMPPTETRDPDVSSTAGEWVDAELLRLRRLLESGNLNCLERVLGQKRMAHALKIGGTRAADGIAEMRHLLAERRVEEAAAGGSGSLVVVDHSFTEILKMLRLPLG